MMGSGPGDEYVYRISSREEWETLQQKGSTLGGDLDKSTGCIHLSKLNQVEWVLGKFYKEYDGQLFLLQIDADKLGQGLVYEALEEASVFPHFYGPLPVDAVIKAHQLVPMGTAAFSCSLLTSS